jgi:hypothetical protein
MMRFRAVKEVKEMKKFEQCMLAQQLEKPYRVSEEALEKFDKLMEDDYLDTDQPVVKFPINHQ